jgi:hypothetical protein
MHGRGGTGEIINLFHFEQDGLSHVVPDKFEGRVIEQVHHVLTPTGKKIIEAQDLVPIIQQAIA